MAVVLLDVDNAGDVKGGNVFGWDGGTELARLTDFIWLSCLEFIEFWRNVVGGAKLVGF